MEQIKISKTTNDLNSNVIINKLANQMKKENQQQNQKKRFVYDETITVGDQPQTFYYNYDNNEYYFTAKNAKFEININGQIVWYYGEWLDGFFRDGLWLDGHWHKGTFCRGNWLDGKWDEGQWYTGQINGTDSDKHP